MNSENNAKLFCRKCGAELTLDSCFCSKCGTAVINPQPDNNQPIIGESAHINSETNEALNSEPIAIQKKGRKKNFKIWALIGTVAVVVGLSVFVVLSLIAPKVEKHDIDSINGCPEFYGVEFGMSADQASALIEVEHKAITGYESSFGSRDSSIYIEGKLDYELYGIPVKDVYCGFDVLKMDSVLLVFSKKDTTLSDVIDLYLEIYGPAKRTSQTMTTWIGTKTTIDVYDSVLLENDDDEIIVRYTITPNSQYKNLSFAGPELDPCSFIDNNIVFSKTPQFYIQGLTVDDDYSIDKYDGYFTKYTLYPVFSFMGIQKNMTAIELNVDANESLIGSVSYIFLLDESNAVDKFSFMYSALTEKYGQFEFCDYTSMKYSDMGVQHITYQEMLNKISNNEQGLYNIQWVTAENRITINLTIDPSKQYIEGAISYAKGEN